MRKLALATLTAGVAALGIVGTALAVNATQTVDVKVTGSKAGTKEKPKGVKLKVQTTLTPHDAVPFATKSAVISLDKNLVINGANFPFCSASVVQKDEKSCPKGSKLGSGSAQGSALGQNQKLTVTAFNAKGGKGLLLHVVGSSPLQINSVLDSKFSNASGKFGKKLTVPIPNNLQQPVPNVYATLLAFGTSISGTAKGKPYVGLKGCTGGKLQFKGVFTFTDGTTKTATSTANCSK